MSLFRREITGIGVDFGTSSVKVVELLQGRQGPVLTTYATVPHKNALVRSASPDDIARMANILRALFERAKVGRGPVYAALPVLSVFSTIIELPVMGEKELETAMTINAKSYVPSPLTEVTLAWTPIGPAEASVAGPVQDVPAAAAVNAASAPAALLGPSRPLQEIFLTAAPRDLVQRYTSVFERLNLTLSALEVESFPLTRSLIRDDRQPTLLVDFGGRTTSFSVVERGYLRFNQAAEVGGDTLTNALVDKLSLTGAEAEERKRTDGFALAQSGGRERGVAVASALRPILMDLVTRAEILRRLYEKKRGRALARTQLIGGGALLPGLADFWTSVTGVPCELGNPWKGIAVPTSLSDHLKRLGPSFAVAVGLALRPFEAASKG